MALAHQPTPLPQIEPVSKIVAEFAAKTKTDALPATALHILRLSLLDWLAVAVAGREEPVSRIVREIISAEGGEPQATVIGFGGRLPARAAAHINGTTSHALDYDDTHFINLGHPSVAVMPAACAIAERTGASGKSLMAAALIGVESAARLGHWLGSDHYQKGFHQTATSGAFGAALAASRLLGLDVELITHALGIAATRASGIKCQFGTMGKPYHAGLAAANGIEAANLAAAGFVSRPDALECEQGFAATHDGAFTEPATVFAGLGKHFIFEDVQHKFHACCHGTHAALEALAHLRDNHNLSADDIDAIGLTVNPRFLAVCNILEPRTGLEAKFSYRLTAAMALTGKDTGALETFSDDICVDPELLNPRDRVTVATDPKMPDSSATVEITLKSGERLSASHELCDPLPATVRERKVRAKAASLLGQQGADGAWQHINAIAASDEPFSLADLIKAARRP